MNSTTYNTIMAMQHWVLPHPSQMSRALLRIKNQNWQDHANSNIVRHVSIIMQNMWGMSCNTHYFSLYESCIPTVCTAHKTIFVMQHWVQPSASKHITTTIANLHNNTTLWGIMCICFCFGIIYISTIFTHTNNNYQTTLGPSPSILKHIDNYSWLGVGAVDIQLTHIYK